MLPHFGKGLVDEHLEILESGHAVSIDDRPNWRAKIRYRLAQAIQDSLARRAESFETLIFTT
jgi:hypothetical protein